MNQMVNSLQMSFSNTNSSACVANSGVLYSIEAHLCQFRDIEPFNILYSSWILEKEEYAKRLSTVGMTYQTFSLHDATHSETILKQLAHFLGENRIRQLSPTDAWLILESAYCHDLGMVVTAKELYRELASMTPEEFKDICRRMNESQDYDIRASWSYLEPLFKYGQQMKRNPENIREISEAGNIEKYKDLENLLAIYHSEWYEWPIHFTKAFMSLIQEYCRPKHAEMSYRAINKEVDEKSYEGLIPLRLRRIIADIAVIHTDERKNIIRKLSHEIEGLGGDYAHPRFVAELIRIGDLLDMDNNRFNQYQLAVADNQSYSSFAHQLKHRSLKNFLITPERIQITADFRIEDALHILFCNNLEELLGNSSEKNNGYGIDEDISEIAVQLSLKAYKEMSGWLKMLHEELGFFSQNWFKIVPESFPGSCAYYEMEAPWLDGKDIENDLVDLRYHITAKRASEIIQGSGLYEDIFVAFIRELLQNSMDAVKRKIYSNLSTHNKHFSNPLEFYRYISRDMDQLVIEIDLRESSNKEYMEFKIRDYGIGVSHKRLKKMQHIGDIKDYENSKQASEMPVWWKPTGSFGIGMQTIFYFAKKFRLISRTEEEKLLRKMSFYSTEIGGRIDAYFIDDLEQAQKFGFGTEINVNISLKMMRLLQQCKSFGKNSDYFGEAAIYKEKIENTIQQIRGSFGLPINLNAIEIDEEIMNQEKYLLCCFGSYFVDLSMEKITKVIDREVEWKDEKYKGFSCWNEKERLLIRYHWQKTPQSPSLKLYYNEILVNDRVLNRKLRVPFFDVEIYIFDENAENYLEVNRDSFLYEKHGHIIDIIFSTNLDCMRFLLKMPENITERSQSQQQMYRDCIWSADSSDSAVYCTAAKEYCQLLLNKEKVSILHPDIYWFIQNNDLITRIEENSDTKCTSLHMENALWLTDTRNRHIGSLRLKKCDACEVRYIVEDAFAGYMELAITELLCMQEIYGDYIIIYKIAPRSELPVTISRQHFNAYIRMQYRALCEEGSKRILLPGIQDYGPLCVSRLLHNLGTAFEKKWNCSIIMPITVKELKELLCKATEKEALELIDKYLTEKNSAYPKIVEYIRNYGIRRIQTEEQIGAAYRVLLIYIWKLLS